MQFWGLEFFLVELYLTALILLLLGADLVGVGKKWIERLYIAGLLGLLFVPCQAIEKNVGMLEGSANPWIHIFVLGALLCGFLQRPPKAQTESYALMLGTLLGLVFMTRASHLIMLLVGVECASFCSYALVGLHSRNPASPIKYLLFGAVVSAIAFYASSWIFGFCGSLKIETVLEQSSRMEVASLLGLVMLTLVFKLAAFPLQQWMADVVEESPVFVAAFVAVLPKIGAAVALQNLLPDKEPIFGLVLASLAVATLYVGNLLALREQKLKTMLAYSAIAQTGFLLLAVAVSRQVLSFYLFVSVLMGIGIFSLPMALEKNNSAPFIKDINTLKNKGLALSATICAAALAGLPLTAGFTAKFLVLSNYWNQGFDWAVVAALLSLPLSWAYLLKIPYHLWINNNSQSPMTVLNTKELVLVYFVGGALFVLFVLPGLLF